MSRPTLPVPTWTKGKPQLAGPATLAANAARAPTLPFPWCSRDPLSDIPSACPERHPSRADADSKDEVDCTTPPIASGPRRAIMLPCASSQRHAASCIGSLQSGDHVCGVYNSDDERWQHIELFFKTGMRNKEKLVYILDAATGNAAVAHFGRILDENRRRDLPLPECPPVSPRPRGTEYAGPGSQSGGNRSLSENLEDDDFVLNFPALLDSGQLVFLHHEDVYLRGGHFVPEEMIAFLEKNIDAAKADGWNGVRVVGEMSWILRSRIAMDQLYRYESLVNYVFKSREASAICHYDRRFFEPQVLLNVMSIHPMTAIGSDVYGNIYYIPPDKLVDAPFSGPELILDYWIQQTYEKKRAENALIRAKDEAQAENKAKSTLLNTISHDLRCPLIGIIGSVEMLRHSADEQRKKQTSGASADVSQEFEDCLRTIEVCGEHLLKLVNGILNYSRVRSTSFEPSEFALHKCLDDTLRVVENSAVEKDIELSVDFDESTQPTIACSPAVLPAGASSETKHNSRYRRYFTPGGPQKFIRTDEYSLRKILINLMGNAVKYTNAGGHIRVSISAEPLSASELSSLPQEVRSAILPPVPSPLPASVVCSSQVSSVPPQGTAVRLLFKFQDDGIGISERDMGRIFDAFQRVDNVRDSEGVAIEGTGLGLSIVRTLSQLIGGGIRVESDGLGKGSTFHFWFPTFLIDYDPSTATSGNLDTKKAADEMMLKCKCLGSESHDSPFEGGSDVESSRGRLRSRSVGRIATHRDDSGELGQFSSLYSQLRVGVDLDEAPDLQPQQPDSELLPAAMEPSSREPGSGQYPSMRQLRHFTSAGSTGGDSSSSSTCGWSSSLAATRRLSSSMQSSDSSTSCDRLSSVSPTTSAMPSPTWDIRKSCRTANTESEPRSKDIQCLRYLVCDDNPLNCKVLKKYLNSFGCSDITVCHDGKSALELVAGPSKVRHEDLGHDQTSSDAGLRADRAFDVILMDYRMPGGWDGVATCKAIRRLPGLGSYPIIACVSAAALEGEEALCLSSGFDDFLIKPVWRKTLEERLNRYAAILAEKTPCS